MHDEFWGDLLEPAHNISILFQFGGSSSSGVGLRCGLIWK